MSFSNASRYRSRFFCNGLISTSTSVLSARPRLLCYNNSRVLANPARLNSTMSATTSGSEDDYASRSQQSPLASQRDRKANTPSEVNRTARFKGYFPLGYKDGFSQWVQHAASMCLMSLGLTILVGQRASCSCRAYRSILYSLPSEAPNPHADRLCTTVNKWHGYGDFR